jgi:hypothetical protein
LKYLSDALFVELAQALRIQNVTVRRFLQEVTEYAANIDFVKNVLASDSVWADGHRTVSVK